MDIRLPISIDHQRKKTKTLVLPFSFYLHLVTADLFETVLPTELKDKAAKLKRDFLGKNRFFSDDYKKEYERSGYIRFLTGPDVHKFLVKVLSLNYQSHKAILSEPEGSFQEYFADLDLFWNKKYVAELTAPLNAHTIREAVFCYACVQSHYERQSEEERLRQKLDVFAKEEIARLQKQVSKLKRDYAKQEKKLQKVEQELEEQKEKNIVLVPSDPHYMLGLHPDQGDRVDGRAKALLKALHPDKSATNETAFLFDMVLKARDMILK